MVQCELTPLFRVAFWLIRLLQFIVLLGCRECSLQCSHEVSGLICYENNPIVNTYRFVVNDVEQYIVELNMIDSLMVRILFVISHKVHKHT